jgi:hypothetical protein
MMSTASRAVAAIRVHSSTTMLVARAGFVGWQQCLAPLSLHCLLLMRFVFRVVRCQLA